MSNDKSLACKLIIQAFNKKKKKKLHMKIFLSKYFLGKKNLYHIQWVWHRIILMWLALWSKKSPSLPSAVIFKRVLAVRRWSEALKSDHTQYLVIAPPVQYRTSECFSHLFGTCSGSVWNAGAGRGSQFLAVNTHPGLACVPRAVWSMQHP